MNCPFSAKRPWTCESELRWENLDLAQSTFICLWGPLQVLSLVRFQVKYLTDTWAKLIPSQSQSTLFAASIATLLHLFPNLFHPPPSPMCTYLDWQVPRVCWHAVVAVHSSMLQSRKAFSTSVTLVMAVLDINRIGAWVPQTIQLDRPGQAS